jgi:Cu/Ag efflux pump CusA
MEKVKLGIDETSYSPEVKEKSKAYEKFFKNFIRVVKNTLIAFFIVFLFDFDNLDKTFLDFLAVAFSAIGTILILNLVAIKPSEDV